MPDRCPTVLRLNATDRDKLKEIAKLEGRSFNKTVEYLIRIYIADYERQHGEVEVHHD